MKKLFILILFFNFINTSEIVQMPNYINLLRRFSAHRLVDVAMSTDLCSILMDQKISIDDLIKVVKKAILEYQKKKSCCDCKAMLLKSHTEEILEAILSEENQETLDKASKKLNDQTNCKKRCCNNLCYIISKIFACWDKYS